jgi:hypothetical protein
MAINVPMPSLPGDALLKGLDTGSNMFAKIMNAKYNNSLHPSGDVANAMYVEQLKNQYGEDDPRYLQAKAAHEMAMSGHQSLIDYRGVLNQTAGIRATSPLGKLINEGKGQGAVDILNGNRGGAPAQGGQANQGGQNVAPGAQGAPANARYKVGEQYYNQEGEPVYDNNPRTPDERKAYEQAIGKGTTDAAIRAKIPYAKNVKITMDSINPQALVQYSGPQGTVKYGIDTLKAAMGSPTPEFMAYQEALTSAKTLSKQLRQFWGDSIQPAATDKIDQLTNPSHWLKDPKVALQQYNQLKKITDQELKTFEKAGTSPVNFDFKDGNFLVTREQKAAKAEQEAGNNEMGGYPDNGEADDQIIAAYGPELIKISPKYTKENIKHTAKQRGISVADVIDQLMGQGGQ